MLRGVLEHELDPSLWTDKDPKHWLNLGVTLLRSQRWVHFLNWLRCQATGRAKDWDMAEAGFKFEDQIRSQSVPGV